MVHKVVRSHPDESPRSHRARVVRWVVGSLAVVLLVCVAAAVAGYILFTEALGVRDDLQAAREQLGSITQAVNEVDDEEFDALVDGVIQHTARANETVGGPLWGIASVIPVVGQNVAAVRKVAEATHVLARDALPGSSEVWAIAQADNLRLEDGGFNLDVFRAALDELPPVSAAFDEAERIVSDIDPDRLHSTVGAAVGEVLDVIDETGPLLRAAEEILPTALRMAGEGEPRTYLVVFQNNAEIRATGGVPSAAMSLYVDDGRMWLGEQTSSSTFADDDHLGLGGQSFTALDPGMLALYDPEIATFSQNYTRTPHFPTTAALFSGLWAEGMDEQLDGVISIDPVVLSYLLAATGPVPLEEDGQEVTAESAVSLLLNEVYHYFPEDGPAADAFFADVAARVFTEIVHGTWDPVEMIDQLSRARDEQRVYAWFAREDEQDLAARLGIDGVLASDNAETTQLGVFVNDAAVSKLGYYLATDVQVACDAGEGTVTTAITLHSDVPDADLGYYTLGLRNLRFGLPQTSMILDVLFFAPPGATIEGREPTVGDIPEWDRSGVENGRDAVSVSIVVPRGESRTVSFTSSLPAGDIGPLSMRHSPTVTTTPVDIAPSCADIVSTSESRAD